MIHDNVSPIIYAHCTCALEHPYFVITYFSINLHVRPQTTELTYLNYYRDTSWLVQGLTCAWGRTHLVWILCGLWRDSLNIKTARMFLSTISILYYDHVQWIVKVMVARLPFPYSFLYIWRSSKCQIRTKRRTKEFVIEIKEYKPFKV